MLERKTTSGRLKKDVIGSKNILNRESVETVEPYKYVQEFQNKSAWHLPSPKMNVECVVQCSVWAAARFGIVGSDCLHTQSLCVGLCLAGRHRFGAGAVGSGRPQATASTESERWVG